MMKADETIEKLLTIEKAVNEMVTLRQGIIELKEAEAKRQEAMEEIVRCAGSYFDPEIVNVFVALWEPNQRTLTGSAAR